MRSNYWVLLASAIVVEVTASLSMKAAQGAPLFYVLVVAGYGASFVFLALILRGGAPIGKTYGIWAASGIALTAMLGSALFDEALTAPMIGGILLVIAGVVLVEFGAGRAHKRGVSA